MGEEKKGARFSRRSFLKSIGGGALGTAVVSTGLIKTDDAAAYVPETVGVGRGKTAVALKVNGKTYRVQVEHRQTLAEVLRDEGYTSDDIARWGDVIREKTSGCTDVFVYFKHEESGKGPAFGLELMRVLARQ